MKMGDAFPSEYLKAEDLKGREVTLTIKDCTIEKLGDDHKPVCTFRETDKRLAVNKTNFALICEVTEKEDSDEWAGKKITIYPTKTEFQGKRVACIRVKDNMPVPTGAGAAKDDEVPF